MITLPYSLDKSIVVEGGIVLTQTPLGDVNTDAYYVYALASELRGVFYVGKGKGDRINQHDKEASYNSANPSRTALVIRDMWASGDVVSRCIYFVTSDEKEAFRVEGLVIEHFRTRYDLVNFIGVYEPKRITFDSPNQVNLKCNCGKGADIHWPNHHGSCPLKKQMMVRIRNQNREDEYKANPDPTVRCTCRRAKGVHTRDCDFHHRYR